MTSEKNSNKILQYFIGRRILVTGGSGYVASNLISVLNNISCTIVRLSRKGKVSKPVKKKAKIVDVCADICASGTFDRVLESIDIVYHFAAQTSVYRAEEEPQLDFRINVLPMLNLLEACRKRGRKPTIIFSGSATEVGMPKRLPVNEAFKDRPVTIYDIHKLMAENYLKHYAQKGDIQGTVLRLANVYGPGPKASSSDRAVINAMMRKALNGESLTVYGKGDFLRDYIYIEDVVSAFLNAATYIKPLNGKHFVVGSGKGYTIAQAIRLVAKRVALRTGKCAKVDHVDLPPSLHSIEFRNFIANPQSFANATGWRVNYSLTEGIDRTINYLENLR